MSVQVYYLVFNTPARKVLGGVGTFLQEGSDLSRNSPINQNLKVI